MFAIAIPTLQYKFTNHELYSSCVASASLGIPNPVRVCSPHMGTRLVRTVPEEDQDDADMMRRGDTVDAFGFKFHVSARPTTRGFLEMAARQVRTVRRAHWHECQYGQDPLADST